MQIKLIKPCLDRGIGSIVTVPDHFGQQLVDSKHAVEIRVKAVAKVDAKVKQPVRA